MTSVLGWLASHWFLVFLFAVCGGFTCVRDFFIDGFDKLIDGFDKLAGARHRRRVRELEARAGIAAAQRDQGSPALPVPGRCVHRRVTAVVGVDDETKAWLCRGCGTQLPADWAVREEDL